MIVAFGVRNPVFFVTPQVVPQPRMGRLAIVLLLLGQIVLLNQATAAEPFLEFLHALQHENYGELSLQYLDTWKKRADVPPETLDVYDLEMATSLRIAAKETTNGDLSQKRLEQAEQLMDKFNKEHPDHPALAKTIVATAGQILDRGEAALAAANSAPNDEAKANSLKEARAAFNEARPKLIDARKRCDKVIASMKGAKEPAKIDMRREAEMAWIDASFKLASGDYSLARTYADKKDKTRLAALKTAGETFEVVSERYPSYPVGRRAHMFYGKMQAEAGDKEGALDTFEEVMTGDTEPTKTSPEMAALYMQAQVFQFQVVLEKDGPAEVLKQAAEWEKEHAPWKRMADYQGVLLEIAKAQLAKAEKSGKDDAAKLRNDASKTIAAVAKIESPYQAEAKELKRVASGSSGGGTNFDDLLIEGDQKGIAGHWDQATESYAKGLKLAEAAGNQKQIADAKKKMTEARYRLARGAFEAKKYEEAQKAAESIAIESPDDPLAPSAAALALYCAKSLYESAAEGDKTSQFKSLKRFADLIQQKWPQKDEADDARSVLAGILISRGDMPGGLALLEKIPNTSRHFPFAVQTVGYAHLKIYRDEKKKAEADRNKDLLAKSRANAVENLRKSLDLQKKGLAAGEPLPKAIVDLQASLGSLALEAKDAKQAVTLLEPLVVEWEKSNKTAKKVELDENVQRMLIATTRAYVESGDGAKASHLVDLLLENGTDALNSNAALVEFAKLLEADRKKTDEELAAASDAVSKQAAKKRQDAAQMNFRNMVDKLCKRENLSIGGLIWLAESAKSVGLTQNASDIYSKILERKKTDPKFGTDKDAAKYLEFIRNTQIQNLQNQNEFQKAIDLINTQIAEQPSSIAPYIAKAKAMQAWAATEETKYGAAAGAWANAREMLGRIPKKPPEFYDAVYNTAVCLMGEFKVNKKKETALQAEKTLRSTLTLYPELSGPEMVKKYNDLLILVLKAQEKDPTAVLNKEKAAP